MEFTTPFYPGTLTPAEQKEIQLSKLWPVVLSLHHNYKLYASYLNHTKSGAELHPMVVMSVQEGTPVISVKDSYAKTKRGRYDTSKPRTILVSTADLADYECEELVQSNNPRYVISKVCNDTTVQNKIVACTKGASNSMPYYLATLAEGYVEALLGNMNRWDWHLSPHSQLSLVHLWEGSRRKEDLAPAIAEECEKVIQSRDAKAAHIKSVVDDAEAMFNKPKWFMGYTKQGWVMGAYHMSEIVNQVELRCNGKTLKPNQAIGPEIHPFRLYKSVDSLPPEEATTLNAILATNKMYIETNLPSMKTLEGNNLFPSAYGTQVCADIGVVLHNQRFMLVDKW